MSKGLKRKLAPLIIFFLILTLIQFVLAQTLWENYITGDDTQGTPYDVYWQAQTFTVGAEDHTITSVKCKWARSDNDPQTVTVGIRAVDGSGHPTGADLTSGTTDGGTLPAYPTFEWREVTLTEYTLSANTKYAIVVRAPDSGPSAWLVWRYDYAGSFANGNIELSSNSGSSWTTKSTWDFMFEVWGNAIDSTAPTYSNINYSETRVNTLSLFSCEMTDETGLSGYIFGTNNTGTMTNDTWTAFSTNPDWGNVTKTLNTTSRIRVEFIWYFNDTSNNWNNTGIQYLTTCTHDAEVGLSFNPAYYLLGVATILPFFLFIVKRRRWKENGNRL